MMGWSVRVLLTVAAVAAELDWHCPVCDMTFPMADYNNASKHPLLRFEGGQTLAIGGQGCLDKFFPAPEKYLLPADAQPLVVMPSRAGETLTCPVSGTTFVAKDDPEYFVQFNGGQVLYVSCKDCAAALRKDPAAFLPQPQCEFAMETAGYGYGASPHVVSNETSVDECKAACCLRWFAYSGAATCGGFDWDGDAKRCDMYNVSLTDRRHVPSGTISGSLVMRHD